MAQKRSLSQLMSEANLTIGSLADRSGVSRPTARRAVIGDQRGQLNTSSATRIANAVGLPVGEINWPGGLANGGRTAGSGGKYTRRPD